MALIIDFHHEDAAELAVSGGKGASLARTARALPVPPGLIVTAEAYRDLVKDIAADLRAVLARLDAGETDVDTAAAEAQELILAAEVPEAWRSRLAALMEQSGLADHAVAVRSSGTMEDLPGAAFAGQHDTHLGVRGVEDVLAKVLACHASLWNAHAMRYRQRLGVDHLEAAMAVVVQQMVEVGAEEAAGVAFSVDPVRGQMGHVLINAAFGLGETVVGGEEPVDEYIVARHGHEQVAETIAEKPHALVSLPDGGTKEVDLSAEHGARPALTEDQRAEVADLAVAAEVHAGFPQDIEWAYSQGRLFLLQSRPVTRVAARLTRDESAERFPTPIAPLTWDLVEDGFHRSLNHSFDLMGLPPFDDKWFVMKDSWIYGNQTAVELYADRLPLRMLTDAESLEAAIPEIIRDYSWVQQLPLQWARDLDTYLLALGRLDAVDPDALDLPARWEHVKAIAAAGNAYFLPNIAISLTQRTLYGALQRMLSMALSTEQAQQVFEQLLSATDTKTGQVNAELWELSRTLRATPELLDALAADGAAAVVDRLETWPEFAAAFTRFLQRHGHRELDFDAYHPTWVEAPHIVLDQIRLMADREDEDHAAADRRAKVTAMETELAVLAEVPDPLRYLVQEVIRLAREYTALDDLEHYQTTRMSPILRRAVRSLGAGLVDEGVLSDPMDAFFLPVADLDAAFGVTGEGHDDGHTPSDGEGAAVGKQDLAPLTAVAAEHKAAYEAACAGTPDWVWGESEAEQFDDDALVGAAGSPGSVEGEVFLVHGPEDFASFPSGAILVARTTNPAWTALFYQASGVITESGGALSHGAVTARELGLPSVMAIRGVMQRLENGQRVRVDGSAGTVSLLQE